MPSTRDHKRIARGILACGAPGNVIWDNNVCHTWYYVNWGYGNISPGVWDGPDPPPDGLAIRQCPPNSFMCP